MKRTNEVNHSNFTRTGGRSEGCFKDGTLPVKFYLKIVLAYLLVNHSVNSSAMTKNIKQFLKVYIC